jgi:legumain
MKVLLVLALLAATTYGAQFAVLVAGSNGWSNYRHQSDVCHSYHVLRNNGIPASNIIVMAYDDIANNRRNRFPGTMYNKPSGADPGSNVYAGCVIDYKGDDVTAANFLAVIQGKNSEVVGGNGRVLESGPEDEVFIFYSDHGSPGLIAFPAGPFLYADDQLQALQYMHDQSMYKQLTYYLEACESGSMFINLPTNTNIYGVSAANPSQSSWATYCPPDDVIAGSSLGACLGDEFSVNWMENTEANDPQTYTLQSQYTDVAKLTLESQVMQWGDLSFTNLPIGTFQGSSKK